MVFGAGLHSQLEAAGFVYDDIKGRYFFKKDPVWVLTDRIAAGKKQGAFPATTVNEFNSLHQRWVEETLLKAAQKAKETAKQAEANTQAEIEEAVVPEEEKPKKKKKSSEENEEETEEKPKKKKKSKEIEEEVEAEDDAVMEKKSKKKKQDDDEEEPKKEKKKSKKE